MPTVPYVNSKGEKLSGVTTIIGSNLGWSKGALMYWAWDMGKQGKDFRQERDKAGDAGTIAHAMIEAFLKKHPMKDVTGTPPEIIGKAETAFLNFLEWYDRNKVNPIAIEPHLISEKYQFGATPDYIGLINDKPSLLDWKSGGVYEDHLIQVSAYRIAWEENHPDCLLDGGFNLIRFSKEEAAFDHKFRQSLTEPWEVFLNLLNIHNLHKQIKKLG